MDLDDFKQNWKKVTIANSDTPLIHPEQLKKITRMKYRKQINKILFPELLIAAFCAFGAFFFTCFYTSFQTTFTQVLALVAIALLLMVPSWSLYHIFRFRQMGQLTLSYTDSLQLFQQQSRLYHRIQPVLAAAYVLLLSMAIVLVPKVYTEELSHSQMAISFAVGSLVLLLCLYKIWQYYKRQMEHTEALLAALEEGQE